MHGCPQKQGGSWDNILLSYARNNGKNNKKRPLRTTTIIIHKLI